MIESRSNETLKAIRRLRRRQGDHALLEGPHLVGAALDAGVELETVLVTARFEESAAGRALLPRLARAPRPVADALLDELADADAPRGLLALARLPRLGASAAPVKPDGLHVFLDGVQDPGNVGAVARVAEAFGAAALLCIRDPDIRTRQLPGHVSRMIGFTAKESEVANLLLSGHSVSSLSAALGISENTARVHLRSLMRKTGMPNGLGAVGFEGDDIPALVAGTVPQHRVTKLSPRPAAEEDLAGLFTAAMRYW